MPIDLKKFCGVMDKWAFDRPWIYKGWQYATDRLMCVRIPVKEPDTKQGEGIYFPTEHAEKLFSEFRNPNMKLVRLFENKFSFGKKDCPWCRGSKSEAEDCECGGDSACEGCAGLGYFIPDEKIPCIRCMGNGKTPFPITCGTAKFTAWQINKICTLLPNVWRGKGDKGKMMYFRFEGGEGVIQPIKDEDSK